MIAMAPLTSWQITLGKVQVLVTLTPPPKKKKQDNFTAHHVKLTNAQKKKKYV